MERITPGEWSLSHRAIHQFSANLKWPNQLSFRSWQNSGSVLFALLLHVCAAKQHNSVRFTKSKRDAKFISAAKIQPEFSSGLSNCFPCQQPPSSRLTFPPCPLISVPTTLEALTNFWGRKHGSQIWAIVLSWHMFLVPEWDTKFTLLLVFFSSKNYYHLPETYTQSSVKICCSTWVAKHKHAQLLSIVHEKQATSWFTTRSIFSITRRTLIFAISWTQESRNLFHTFVAAPA